MNSRLSAERRIELRLINLKLATARLRVNADNSNRAARTKMQSQLKTLNEMETLAESKLAELKEASDESWHSLRLGVEEHWESLAKIQDEKDSA